MALLVVIQQPAKRRESLFRLELSERLDCDDPNIGAWAVEGFYQILNCSAAADLPERRHNFVVDMLVWQQGRENGDGSWVLEFSKQMDGIITVGGDLSLQGPPTAWNALAFRPFGTVCQHGRDCLKAAAFTKSRKK